ncbi:hypothetical protein VD659_18205 [Herbiconiux sp. 11R-BC]|uniref:hypothetical protein n=1 Tax=Herbiconiux sp. 11R-BC TaxID=3111637 RepID=UPI003BFF71C7
MTETIDQFREALEDAAARRELGISMTDQEARDILVDDAAVSDYYAIWAQDRGRRAGNAGHWQPTAVAGFVLAVVSIVGGGFCFAPIAWEGLPLWVVVGTVVGIVLSANGLSACAANGTRGRGLAIWGIVLGCVAALGGIALIIYFVSS